MTRIQELTAEEEKDWAAWLAERPACIREVAAKYPPWELYMLKSSGHRVVIASYGEPPSGRASDVTFTVLVGGEYNFVAFERNVFGITQSDLEPCGLAPADELIGNAGMDKETALTWVRARKKDSDAAEWYIAKYGRKAFEDKFVTPRLAS